MRKSLYVILLVLVSILFVGCTASLPELRSEAVEGATELIDANPDIDDPEIVLEDDLIKFYFAQGEGLTVSQDRLRQLGIDYVKLLAGYVATDEIAGPSEDSYGQIYDYYDVEIIIEGERGEVLDTGIMKKGKHEIQWQGQ